MRFSAGEHGYSPPGQVNNHPLEWTSLINFYHFSIHKHASLDAVTKFQYLFNISAGKALNLTMSLPLSAALDLLRSCYQSPYRLVTMHLNQMLDIPPLNYENILFKHM